MDRFTEESELDASAKRQKSETDAQISPADDMETTEARTTSLEMLAQPANLTNRGSESTERVTAINLRNVHTSLWSKVLAGIICVFDSDFLIDLRSDLSDTGHANYRYDVQKDLGRIAEKIGDIRPKSIYFGNPNLPENDLGALRTATLNFLEKYGTNLEVLDIGDARSLYHSTLRPEIAVFVEELLKKLPKLKKVRVPPLNKALKEMETGLFALYRSIESQNLILVIHRSDLSLSMQAFKQQMSRISLSCPSLKVEVELEINDLEEYPALSDKITFAKEVVTEHCSKLDNFEENDGTGDVQIFYDFPSPRAFSNVPWYHQARKRFLDLVSETHQPLASVTVAIIDTGADTAHPELIGRILEAKSFIPGEMASVDTDGHGTHCSGVIAGKTCGLAFNGSLRIFKAVNGKDEVLANALKHIVERKKQDASYAHVVTMSCGSQVLDQQTYFYINEALALGIIVVCAAANEGSLHQQGIAYPARIGSVICVGSHDKYGLPSPFSSRGRELDFMAPGEKIFSCVPLSFAAGDEFHTIQATDPKPWFCYQTRSGTSMATPFVTGIIALLLGMDLNKPEASRQFPNTSKMRDYLSSLCRNYGGHTDDRGYGVFDPRLIHYDNNSFSSRKNV